MTISTASTLRRYSESSASSKDVFVEVVKDFEGLKPYASKLEELSSATLEQNPFYEDWMMLPASRFLKAELDLRFVLVFARNHSEPNQQLLCGLFPLVRHNRWKGSFNRVYSLWQHPYFSLCAPPLRLNYARQCLEALFDYLASDREKCSLIEFSLINADGPFNILLSDFLKESEIPNLTFNRFARSVYHPQKDEGGHLCAALSSKYRSQLRRKRARLSGMGTLEFAELQPDGDVSRWIDEFLKLEAKGWKGREKSALGCNQASRSFFIEAAEEAFRRGQLRMLEFRLDGKLLAQRCSFISGQESFLFKLAYDEDFARFSPGVLLELENMERLNASGSIEDSCAAPNHPLFDHLWTERKMMQTTLASCSKSGALAISAIEMYRWFKRRLPASVRNNQWRSKTLS